MMLIMHLVHIGDKHLGCKVTSVSGSCHYQVDERGLEGQ